MEIAFILVIALPLILIAWSVVDIVRLHIKEKLTVNFLWLLLIFLLPIIGSIIYWQLGRPSIRNKRVFRPDFNKW